MKAGEVFFRDVNMTPPGGLYFCEIGGERVQAHTFLEIAPRVRELMRKHGVEGTAEMVVAAYMCPRIPNPGLYCRGAAVPAAHVNSRDAIANSLPYCSRRVVPFDVIERRMRVCAACPMHKRDWCPTCTGHMSRMKSAFGGRRRAVPEDTLSGVCQKAKAYEYAIASVEYGEGETVWAGVPDTCWRKTGV